MTKRKSESIDIIWKHGESLDTIWKRGFRKARREDENIAKEQYERMGDLIFQNGQLWKDVLKNFVVKNLQLSLEAESKERHELLRFVLPKTWKESQSISELSTWEGRMRKQSILSFECVVRPIVMCRRVSKSFKNAIDVRIILNLKEEEKQRSEKIELINQTISKLKFFECLLMMLYG